MIEELHERVTRLEENHNFLREQFKTQGEKLDAIHTELTRYKGAWGMLGLIVSSVVTALLLFKDWIRDHWK